MSTTATVGKPQPLPKRQLAFVTPEQRVAKLNVLLYGPPKRGKSTGAAGAPGPILYLNPEPSNALDFPRHLYGPQKIREFPIRGRQDLVDASLYLRDGGGGEKTVVLDTVGETWRVLVEEITGEAPRASIQQYGDVGTIIQRFCRFLTRDVPMNVVLVCHEQYQDIPEGTMLLPQTGGKQNPMILCSMVDVVAYVGVEKKKDAPPRYVGQVEPAAGRYAGHRHGILGTVADLDLTDWCERYARLQTPAPKER